MSTISQMPESFDPSTLSPYVLAFAKLMQVELALNSHKGLWNNIQPYEALEEIWHHYQKLCHALATKQRDTITEHAADLGNCAMMLLDSLELLDTADAPTPPLGVLFIYHSHHKPSDLLAVPIGACVLGLPREAVYRNEDAFAQVHILTLPATNWTAGTLLDPVQVGVQMLEFQRMELTQNGQDIPVWKRVQ